jgi:hypothetical protein
MESLTRRRQMLERKMGASKALSRQNPFIPNGIAAISRR